MIKLILYFIFVYLIFLILKNISFSKKNKDNIIDADYEEIE